MTLPLDPLFSDPQCRVRNGQRYSPQITFTTISPVEARDVWTALTSVPQEGHMSFARAFRVSSGGVCPFHIGAAMYFGFLILVILLFILIAVEFFSFH